MLFLLSPAKTLDYDSSSLTDDYTTPKFLGHSKRLISILEQMTPEAVAELMSVSDKIAELNVQRYKDWQVPFTLQNAKQAVFAFKGDVYTGLAIESANNAVVEYVQKHVRILSGLYGLLHPLDLMQPYRLEMGTKLENDEGSNLYKFWGSTITNALNEELEGDANPIIINLASNEYYKSVQPKNLNARIITPIFKDLKNDQYKIVSFYAKKARGLMVRYAADHAINDVNELKGFNYEGYAFNEALSSEDDWVFTRDVAPKK